MQDRLPKTKVVLDFRPARGYAMHRMPRSEFREYVLAQLRQLDEERARLMETLAIWDRGQPREIDLSGLALDDLTVSEAMRRTLLYAAERGCSELTTGELESALAKFKLVTSQKGAPVSRKSLWKIITHTLQAPGNKEVFRYVKSGRHVLRGEKVSLANRPPPSLPKWGRRKTDVVVISSAPKAPTRNGEEIESFPMKLLGYGA